MTGQKSSDDVWKKRWMLLNVLTVSGIIFALLGLAIWRVGVLGLQDELVGKLVFVAGIIDALLIPVLLRRSWRSKKDDA